MLIPIFIYVLLMLKSMLLQIIIHNLSLTCLQKIIIYNVLVHLKGYIKICIAHNLVGSTSYNLNLSAGSKKILKKFKLLKLRIVGKF